MSIRKNSINKKNSDLMEFHKNNGCSFFLKVTRDYQCKMCTKDGDYYTGLSDLSINKAIEDCFKSYSKNIKDK